MLINHYRPPTHRKWVRKRLINFGSGQWVEAAASGQGVVGAEEGPHAGQAASNREPRACSARSVIRRMIASVAVR